MKSFEVEIPQEFGTIFIREKGFSDHQVIGTLIRKQG